MITSKPRRRLSILRLLLSLIVVCGLALASVLGVKQILAERIIASNKPWFAAYVDITATPEFQFQQIGSSTARDAVLSFIVSSPQHACTPTWGGAYTLSQAASALDLDTRIARLQQEGGSVAVSFGGKANSELAVNCTNPAALLSAYKSVLDRYKLNTIDLDIEGNDLTNYAAGQRRAVAIAKLQHERRSEGKKLAVWLTLPVTPQGLSIAGTTAVSQMLKAGVDLAGVNVMTMDYGSSLTNGQNMLSGSESALVSTERQLGILYQQAGIHLNSTSLWLKLGATPMIGQNDMQNEVFSLADAKAFNQFALDHNMGRMSMWSANRDITCGPNYVDVKVVSDSCSGVSEAPGSFAKLLGNGFDGSITLSAGLITKADPINYSSQTPDNPATSPYPIWSPTSAYLEGSKIVWHHNIYVAKWWTQGNVPDDPVLQAWQTPWQLIGPVLPGEKPAKEPTLPAGYYAQWTGTAIYNTGQRVLFNGVPYQAKWWNQGQSPAAATSDPGNSPWAPLTQAQINALLAQAK